MNDELKWLALNNYIGISHTEDKPKNMESTKEPSYYLPITSEPEQIKRQKRAIGKHCTPLSVNTYNKTGVFSSSSSGTYSVTTTSCTCPDFIKRKKPCKHMYRLLDELGLYSLKNAFPNEYEKLKNQKQINDILPIATHLSLEYKKLYRTICCKFGNDNEDITCYPLPKDTARRYINSNLLVETKDPKRLIHHANFYDLRNKVKELTSDKLPRKKVDLIAYILENFPEMDIPLDSGTSYVVLPDEISHLAMTLYMRLDEQIDAEVYKTYYEYSSYNNNHNVNASYQYHDSSYDNYYCDHVDNFSNYEYDDPNQIGCLFYILITAGIIIGIYLFFSFMVFVVSSI
nr:SWIM zinc finger family protein [uncultured Catonella sp.]